MQQVLEFQAQRVFCVLLKLWMRRLCCGGVVTAGFMRPDAFFFLKYPLALILIRQAKNYCKREIEKRGCAAKEPAGAIKPVALQTGRVLDVWSLLSAWWATGPSHDILSQGPKSLAEGPCREIFTLWQHCFHATQRKQKTRFSWFVLSQSDSAGLSAHLHTLFDFMTCRYTACVTFYSMFATCWIKSFQLLEMDMERIYNLLPHHIWSEWRAYVHLSGLDYYTGRFVLDPLNSGELAEKREQLQT